MFNKEDEEDDNNQENEFVNAKTKQKFLKT
jgi:hypothetical protein